MYSGNFQELLDDMPSTIELSNLSAGICFEEIKHGGVTLAGKKIVKM